MKRSKVCGVGIVEPFGPKRRALSTSQSVRLVANHFLGFRESIKPGRLGRRPAVPTGHAFVVEGLARRIGRTTHTQHDDGRDVAFQSRSGSCPRSDSIVAFDPLFVLHLTLPGWVSSTV